MAIAGVYNWVLGPGFTVCAAEQVFTSDIRGAGTDANVTITMFGSSGIDTGKIKLDSNKNDFERGQVSLRALALSGAAPCTSAESRCDA